MKRTLGFFECRKLLQTRYLWVFLALFLAINAGLAFEEAHRIAERLAPRERAAFCAYYEAHTEELDAYYDELKAIADAHDPFSEEPIPFPPNRYAPEGEQDYDWLAMARLTQSDDYESAYHEAIDRVITLTEMQMTEYASLGMEDTYTYRFQERTRDVYRGMRDAVTFQDGYVYGWGEYFTYDAYLVFLFFSVTLLAVTVMSSDRTADMLPVIHCTRRGKRSTMGAKVAVIGVGTVLLTLAFSLSSCAVFGVNLGFSSADGAVQAVSSRALFVGGEAYSGRYVPFPVSVGEYHLMLIGVRALGLLLFAAFVTAVAALVRSSLPAMLIGLLAYGGNVYLSGLRYIADNDPLKNLNLIHITSACHVTERFRTLNIGGHCVAYLPLTAGLCLVLGGLLFGLSCLVYIKRRGGMPSLWRRLRLSERASVILDCVRNRLPVWEIKCTGIARSEMYKLLVSSGMAFLLVLLLILKIICAPVMHEPTDITGEMVLHNYLTRLEGPVTEEKLALLAEERRAVDETLQIYETMEADYLAGYLSTDDYFDYLEAYDEARITDGYLALIEERRDYLLSLRADGREGWFVYDLGWSKLFDPGVDFLLLIAICMTLSGVFAVEYKSGDTSDGFARMLKTTVHGRRRTFGAKMGVTTVVTACACTVSGAVDIAAIAARYSLPAAEAPLVSMPIFGAYNGGMTIAQYIPLCLVTRLFFGLLLGLLAAALSALLRQSMTTLLAVSSVLIIPAVPASVGFGFARYANYLAFLSATPLMAESFACELFGLDFGLWLATAVLTSALVGGLALWARHKFVT